MSLLTVLQVPGKALFQKNLCHKLGFIYVDTGALYRSVGVYALRNGINTKSGEQLKKALPDIKVELAFKDGVQHVYLNGEDVSEEIRTPKLLWRLPTFLPCRRSEAFFLICKEI